MRLLALWTCLASLRLVAALVRPSELFTPPAVQGQQIALLPDAAFEGVIVDALQGVESAEACAEKCRAALPNCSFFTFCKSSTCSTLTYGQLEQGECLLLSRNCTLPADREAAQGAVSGFPIHVFPGPVVEAFPTFLAQAIVGADFPCDTSEVDKGNKCAFTNVMSALFKCVQLSNTCVAVTVYANGTNGCSDKPLAVLKSVVPTSMNTFASSDVYTVALTEAQKALRTVFMFADQAELDLPSEEDIKATGADAPDSLQYKGCQIGANFLYHGDIVALLDNVPSAAACCRECTARNVAAGRRVCTVFNYCSTRNQGGCSYKNQADDKKSVSLQQGQCELRFQPLSTSITSLPPSLLAAGADVPFEAGAPNALWEPEVPGFRRLPGETIALSGAFACEGSLRPETGECVLPGTLQESADWCMRSSECMTFSYRPAPQTNSTNGTQSSGAVPMLTSFKGKSDLPNQLVFPTAVLYIKDSNTSAGAASSGGGSGSSSSSGLSGGAVAGIAVGAVAGAAAITGCAWLLLQRQRRRQPSAVKAAEEATDSNAKLETGGSWGSDGALRTAGSVPRCSPGSAGLGSGGSKRHSVGGASGDAIPELVQYVAAHEASLATNGTISPQPSLQAPWEDSQLLPPHLLACMVDASQLTYLRRADGSLWQIGSGASSKVYRVEYRGEVLAAKEVDLGGSQSLRETFVTEARMLHQLRHPNVVGFAGVTFRAQKGVVLMELCEGRDLHSALQLMVAGSQDRLFAWHRRGKRVALDIAKAMNFLHQNNVVHMDIKSPNILLTSSGTAKLADVGFSKSKHDSILSSVSSFGTFSWAAPELLLGTERPTSKVDVYSYGVALWEIITGERPQRGQLRMPRDDECPEEVRELMLACLAEKPSARPTALQVLQRLRELVEGSTPPAGSPGAPSSAAGSAPVSGETPPGAPAAAHIHVDGVPQRAVAAASIQLRPTPPSPFAS